MKKRWSTWLAVGAAIVMCSAACSSSGGEDGATDAAGDVADTSVDVASDSTQTTDVDGPEDVTEITPDSVVNDTTDGDGTAPGTDVIADTDVAKDTDVAPDTDTTNPDDFAELLVKILGPGGRESLQSEGQAMQIAGVVYGGPDTMTWSNSNGQTGSVTPNANWQSPIILLDPGDNILTVTATKGTVVVTDTVRVTYNPYFSFEGPPEVGPDLMFVNEPSKLVVRMRLTAASPGPDGSSVVNPATIQLIEVDAAGKLVQEHTKLLDSGSSTNCDDVQKDSVFSNCLNVAPSAPKTMYFRVRATVTLPGKTFEAFSPVAQVDVVQRFDQTECTQIVSLQKQVKAAYMAALQADGPVKAQAQAIASLKSSSIVAEAGPASGGGYGVWVRYLTGRVGALNLAPAGTRGGPGEPGLPNGAPQTYNVGTRRALTLSPFAQEFKVVGAGDEADVAGTVLQDKQCPPFSVDALSGSSAMLKYYRAMSTYGVIAISGHGEAYFGGMDTQAKQGLGWEHLGSQEVIWSGEPVTCSALSTGKKSCNQQGAGCSAGETCVKTETASGVCVDHTQGDIMRGRVVIGDETYGVLPSFIQRHSIEPFPASIVYLGTCRSLWNGSMAVQLLGNGAAAVVGYSDYVSNAFAFAEGGAFFDGLLQKDENVLQASSTAQDPTLPGRMRFVGNSKARASEGGLMNPGWDLGKVTGWKQIGDGRVISRLGVTTPVQGKFMGIISTGLGFTAQSGSLEQPFCVPPATQELCFYWKFYSEEFLEYCGSAYMDRFTATLTAETGKMTLTDVWIDPLCPYDCDGKYPCEAGSPQCKCGQQWKTLTKADVSFDVGGVFMTPWQTSCKDVSTLAGSGKKVTLKFFATDIGDSILDTAILLDDVTVK
jgi:hypothetical protein